MANSENSSSFDNESKAGDQQVQMDRRWKDRRAEDRDELAEVENELDDDNAVEEGEGRRKKQRRRQIDPTTCERDYSDDEILFMRALDDYKRNSGRMFPTCSEILEVVRALGYVRLTEEESQLLESIQEVEDEIAENLNNEPTTETSDSEDSLV